MIYYGKNYIINIIIIYICTMVDLIMKRLNYATKMNIFSVMLSIIIIYIYNINIKYLYFIYYGNI
jgi:hypothetical protein